LNKKAFKTDESFLEKISIGAIGTKRVFNDLRDKGHSPIELERGSMSFKIWKEIKIKRIRVPYLLCLDCRKRVESRAKTKLEVSMSHSYSSPERGWDYGLNDEDFIALVKCTRAGERPIDWRASEFVNYIPVEMMRESFKKDYIIAVRPKGATEGFEARITWPSAVASNSGTIINIGETNIQYRRSSDNRVITNRLLRNGIKMNPLVEKGEYIKKGQIIASVVPVLNNFECKKTEQKKTYLSMLKSSSLSEKYAAAKALSYFGDEKVNRALSDKMLDEKEHIYIRLEAAASLLKMGEKAAIEFFKKSDPLPNVWTENVLV